MTKPFEDREVTVCAGKTLSRGSPDTGTHASSK